MPRRVLVTGSRKWTDKTTIWAVLDRLNPEIVIHGGALGADAIAHEWCKKRGKRAMVFFSDYSKKEGSLSPPLRRNIEMLDEGPDVVAGFPFPDSRGTRFTLREAAKRGLRCDATEGE